MVFNWNISYRCKVNLIKGEAFQCIYHITVALLEANNTLKWFALSSIVRCMRIFHGCLIVKTKIGFLQISYICQMS
jgi:hypothetical protein